jgi:ankyrin repeat protein
MTRAVLIGNACLMDDILKRYNGEVDDILDEYGNTLLTLATINGDHKMVQLLLDRGFSPTA